MAPLRPVIQVIALRVLRRHSKGGRGAKCQECSGWHPRGPGGVEGVFEGTVRCLCASWWMGAKGVERQALGR